MKTKVLSVGGSIIAPNKPDTDFLLSFSKMISHWISENTDTRLILVAGGGGPARTYQNAYRETSNNFDLEQKRLSSFGSGDEVNTACDWLGIMATRLNAQLLKTVFGPLCLDEIVTDPEADIEFKGKILVAAGWKPGFSTDNDAVLLAKRFGADTVINLSNIEKVYTDDPKKNPEAKPLTVVSWDGFCTMVGDKWEPGKNCPFDPIASKKAQELSLKVICASGKNIENIKNILDGKDYIGTTIS